MTPRVVVGKLVAGESPGWMLYIVAAVLGLTDSLLYRPYNNPVSGPSKSEELNAPLRRLKAPVCVEHSKSDALSYSDGVLSFASYRYYKAFCDLNRIATGKPPVDAAPPQARVVTS